MPIELQHKYKKESTLSLFKKIGKVENIEALFDEFVSSPNVFHYRNKMEYGFSAIGYDRVTKRDKDEFTLGFKRRGVWWMGDNLDKDSGLFDKQMEDNLKNIRQYCIDSGLDPWHGPKREGFFRYFVVRKSFKTDELLCNLVTTSPNLDQFDLQKFANFLKDIFGDRLAGLLHTINDETGDRTIATSGSIELVHGKDKVVEELLGLEFEISIQSFFQTNPKCAERLYNKVIEYAGENTGEGIIMDMFCGTGTISQLLAKGTGKDIVGVDIVESAIEDARANARRNKIKNVRFFASDVGKFLLKHPEYNGEILTIVLDPPRAGIAPKTLKKVISLNAKTIVYVSCNPATQARDTETLRESGYELVKLSMVDQFPHTGHIESIALFKK